MVSASEVYSRCAPRERSSSRCAHSPHSRRPSIRATPRSLSRSPSCTTTHSAHASPSPHGRVTPGSRTPRRAEASSRGRPRRRGHDEASVTRVPTWSAELTYLLHNSSFLPWHAIPTAGESRDGHRGSTVSLPAASTTTSADGRLVLQLLKQLAQLVSVQDSSTAGGTGVSASVSGRLSGGAQAVNVDTPQERTNLVTTNVTTAAMSGAEAGQGGSSSGLVERAGVARLPAGTGPGRGLLSVSTGGGTGSSVSLPAVITVRRHRSGSTVPRDGGDVAGNLLSAQDAASCSPVSLAAAATRAVRDKLLEKLSHLHHVLFVEDGRSCVGHGRAGGCGEEQATMQRKTARVAASGRGGLREDLAALVLRRSTDTFPVLIGVTRADVVFADAQLTGLVLTLLFNLLRAIPAETRRRVGRQCVRLGLHTVCSGVLHRHDCVAMTVGRDGVVSSASVEAISCAAGRDVCRCYEAAGLLLALLTCVQPTIATEVLLGQDLQRLLHGALQLTSRLQSRFANYRTLSDFDCTLDARRVGGGAGQTTSDDSHTSPWSSSLLLTSVSSDGNHDRVLAALQHLHEVTADHSVALHHLCTALFTLSKPFLHSRTLGTRAVMLCTNLMELLTPFLYILAPRLATVIAAPNDGTRRTPLDASLHRTLLRNQSELQSASHASSTPKEPTITNCPVTAIAMGGAVTIDERARSSVNNDMRSVDLLTRTPLWDGSSVVVPHWLTAWWYELEMLEMHAVVLLRRLAGAVVGGASAEERRHSPVKAAPAARGVVELSSKEREAFLQTLPLLMRLTAGIDPPRHTDRTTERAAGEATATPSPQWAHHVELVYTVLMTMQSIFAMDRLRSLALLRPLGGLKTVVQRVLSLSGVTAERWHEFYLTLCSLYALHRLPASAHIADPHSPNQRAPLPSASEDSPRLGATMTTTPVVPMGVSDDEANVNEERMSAEEVRTPRDVATLNAEVTCGFDPAQFAPELHDAVIAPGTALPPFDAIALPWPFTDVPPPSLSGDVGSGTVTSAADVKCNGDVDETTPLRPPTAEQRARVMRHCIRRLARLDETRSDDAGGVLRHEYAVVYERSMGTACDDALQPCVAVETRMTDGLRFYADFESGNLQRAIATGEREYDLVLAWDTCTNSFVQWFFFAVTNYAAGQTYRFNILNMEKPGSTFNEGQCPLLLHVQASSSPASSQPAWRRVWATGEDDGTMYFANPYRRPPRQTRHTPTQPFSTSHPASPPVTSPPSTTTPTTTTAAPPRRQYYYTLSFAVTMPLQAGGRVYLANCFPYRYTDLLHDLQRLNEGVTTDSNDDDDEQEGGAGAVRPWVCVQSLCTSPAGLPVPIVTVTNPPRLVATRAAPLPLLARRPVCVLVARVHPGESNASWMMRGVLDCLLGRSPPCDRAVVRDLLDRFVFKIVPMLNVDGVVMGNHRCSLFGVDLNRDYLQPSAVLNPVVDALTRLVRYMIDVEQRRVTFFGDFHGHSRARNVPLYGEIRTLVLPPATPPASRVGAAGVSPRPPISRGSGSVAAGSPLGDLGAVGSGASPSMDASSSERGLHVAPEKLLPCVMAARFTFVDVAQSFYAVPRYKRGTSRAVMYQVCGIRMSYTIEGSMMGGYTATRACETHYSTGHYGRIGVSVLLALHMLLRAEAEVDAALAATTDASRAVCETEDGDGGLPAPCEEKTVGEGVLERAWQLFGSHGIVDTAQHTTTNTSISSAATGQGIAAGGARRSQSVPLQKNSVSVVRGLPPSHSMRPAARPQPPSHSPRPPLAGTAVGSYAMARRQERRGPLPTPPSTFAATVAAATAGGAVSSAGDAGSSVEPVVASDSGSGSRRGGVGVRAMTVSLPPLPPFVALSVAQRKAVLACLLRDRPVTRRSRGVASNGTADAPEDNVSDDAIADSVEAGGVEDSISEDDAEASRTCSFSEQLLGSMTDVNEDDDAPSM